MATKATAEAMPMDNREGLTSKMVVQFDITDAAIAVLSQQYTALTVKDVDDKAGFKAVHEARMDIVKRRTSVEKKRKALKEDALVFGRAVDAEAKRITSLLEPIETHLDSEEKKVTEELARRKAEAEAREAARIQARVDRLFNDFDAKFNGQIYSAYGLQIPAALVKVANDEQFEGFIAQLKAKKDAEVARIAAEEAERKSEKERLAKIAAEQEAERERLAALAREQEEAVRKVREKEEALEREKKRLADEEAARQKAIADEKKLIEDEKRRVEELKKAEAEAAEKARKEAEEKAKREAEEKAEAERMAKEEAARQEALRPDKEKLLIFANTLDTLSIPEVGEAAQQIVKDIKTHLTKTANHIRKQVKEL